MDKDFDTRKTEFLEKYKALIDEYHVDFLSIPKYVPGTDGRSWGLILDTQIMDTTDSPVKSPFSI